ncbi:thioredoxin domain-containing protein 9 [Ditylenchus destructor]|uniref:Thioredoxin domain-containing protein 9 n=1 Tax=Ditylenchus destructor TaxID=166010 RepID=A0AAD4NGE6_9BILA|nr:thioredoxin domain-containing protein 9 [Ditylenchus destructor]
MENKLASELLRAAKIVESKLDEELANLEKSDEQALEDLRRKRLQEMRAMQKQKEELTSMGHGKLAEVTDEREFFDATKNSSKVVCHFYDPIRRKSAVIDMLLDKLASKHLSVRFIKANTEKVPFLIKRLNIRKIPTIGIAIDSKMVDFIRIDDEFGPSNELKTELLEARLSNSGVIDVQKATSSANTKMRHPIIRNVPKKTIRDKASSGSDEDW